LLRSFNLVCPFCEDLYPFPDTIDEIYRCRCGAVYRITYRSEMEDAVDQLTKSFLKDESNLRGTLERNILCQAVVYEDIQNLIRMKREYEALTLIRAFQSFDQDYPQKLVLVWLGNDMGML